FTELQQDTKEGKSHLNTVFPFFLQICSQILAQVCQTRCLCPQEPPMCAPGVQLILDDCACCLVCARQKGEACSEISPCDTHRGLNCDYTADVHQRTGVCVAHEGDICLLDGSVYQNGETFFPSCKYQCTCRDGQIACVPRCNLDVMLPGPDCPLPRKVAVPGECCEKWVCEPQPEANPNTSQTYVSSDALLWDPSTNCIEQTTEWGACSRTCGMSISTRQMRLCIVRPCDKQQGSKCLRMKKAVKPVRFSYKNCTSVLTYKPRYCGVCTDGRCCTPHSTETVQVEFQCAQGKAVKKPVMFINTCACHYHCPRDNVVYRPSDLVYSGYRL
uniref:Cellular communication network factor 3 n=1 Tax=Oncorhynchus tshawytscha TaxID=74940 RepID=A0AAZ3S558_ONCTS